MSPMREVAKYVQCLAGAKMTLSCGHETRVAGLTQHKHMHACNQSPCYKPERVMGNNH